MSNNNIFTMEAKTINPTTFCVWGIDRETKNEVEFAVQAFTVKQALEIARAEYTKMHEKGIRIRVCVEESKYEKAKEDWVVRLEAKHIKSSSKTIGKVKELRDLIADYDTFHKVCEIFGVEKYIEYID